MPSCLYSHRQLAFLSLQPQTACHKTVSHIGWATSAVDTTCISVWVWTCFSVCEFGRLDVWVWTCVFGRVFLCEFGPLFTCVFWRVFLCVSFDVFLCVGTCLSMSEFRRVFTYVSLCVFMCFFVCEFRRVFMCASLGGILCSLYICGFMYGCMCVCVCWESCVDLHKKMLFG